MAFRAVGSTRIGGLVAGSLAILAVALGCTEQPAGLDRKAAGGGAGTTPSPKASGSGSAIPEGGVENTGGSASPGTAASSADPSHDAHHGSPSPGASGASPAPTPTEPPIAARSYGIELINVSVDGKLTLYQPPDIGPAHPDYPNSFQLQVKVTMSDGTFPSAASWSVAPATVATVSAGNKLSALKAGSATLTAKTLDGLNSATVSLTVKAEGGLDAEVQ